MRVSNSAILLSTCCSNATPFALRASNSLANLAKSANSTSVDAVFSANLAADSSSLYCLRAANSFLRSTNLPELFGRPASFLLGS
jgi:hypothetical protein